MNMMTASLNYLSARQRSEKTVRTYLEEEFGNTKKIHPQISALLEQLKAERLIDDARLAKTLASHYTHKGNRFIAELLKDNGIPEQIISDTLSQLESEVIRALKELTNRLGGFWDNSEATISFAYRFLNGRRYSHLTARIVVNELSSLNLISSPQKRVA
ncbi:MAG: RecX family transcriptional regulator [Tatlockia sp.]|nr:RecX family transcriptional regulator [Tatlockia sp.]